MDTRRGLLEIYNIRFCDDPAIHIASGKHGSHQRHARTMHIAGLYPGDQDCVLVGRVDVSGSYECLWAYVTECRWTTENLKHLPGQLEAYWVFGSENVSMEDSEKEEKVKQEEEKEEKEKDEAERRSRK